MGFDNGYGFTALQVNGGGGGGGNAPIPIVYADLVKAIAANQLVPGSNYLITDFATVYDVPDYYYAGYLSGAYQFIPAAPEDIDTATGTNEPLIVTAATSNSLEPYAISTVYPTDTIQYDVSFSATEVIGTAAFGRISERISAPGIPLSSQDYALRTDYDWRAIQYIRYENYVPKTLNPVESSVASISTSISGNFATSVLSVNSSSGFTAGDVIQFDTQLSVQLKFPNSTQNGQIGFFAQINRIIDGNTIQLQNIDTTKYPYPITQTFTNSVPIRLCIRTGIFNSISEVFANQRGVGERVNDLTTFTANSGNIYIGNYADAYSTTGNPFILSNNVFAMDSFGVTTGSLFYNNSLQDTLNAQFGDFVSFNTFSNSIEACIFGNEVYSNIISGVANNCVFANAILENYFQNISALAVGATVVANQFSIDLINTSIPANLTNIISSSTTNAPVLENSVNEFLYEVVDRTTFNSCGKFTSDSNGRGQLILSDINGGGDVAVVGKVLSNNNIAYMPDTSGGYVQVNAITEASYGSTIDLSNKYLSGGIYDFVYSNGTGTSTFLLPTGTKADIGTIIIISDLLAQSNANPITIDAGTGNTITLTNSYAQTCVLNGRGESFALKKVTSTAWMVQGNG